MQTENPHKIGAFTLALRIVLNHSFDVSLDSENLEHDNLRGIAA